jgi:hypothetical protein
LRENDPQTWCEVHRGKLNPDAAPSRDTAPAGAMDAILIMPSMEMADTKPAPQLVGDRT